MGSTPRKNRIRRWLPGLVATGLLVTTLACGGGGGGGGKKKGPGTLDSLVATPTAVMLRDVGSTVSLAVTGVSTTKKKTDLTAAAEGTTYLSSDTGVADVSVDGVVTRIGAGTATITVTNSGVTLDVPVYSDDSPGLAAGDFDFFLGEGPVPSEDTFEVPVLLEAGADEFGSYRARVTFDPAHFEFLSVKDGADVPKPLAARSDGTAGEVEILGTYDAGAGQPATGTLEIARLVLRAAGAPGDASRITGEAVEVFDPAFPAAAIGPATPRPFVAGNRWLAIE